MAIRFACPWCQAQLKVPPEKAGTKHRCPECSSLVVVPDASEPVDAAPARDGYAIREEPRETAADTPVEPSGDAGSQADEGAQDGATLSIGEPPMPKSQRPVLPRRPLVSGIVTFLFYPGSLLCWFELSAGILLVLGLIAGARALGSTALSTATGPSWFIGMMMSAASVILAVSWLAAASVSLLAVLQDTAAGNKRVVNWPGLAFLDWIADALYVVNSVVVCVLVGVLIAWGLESLGTAGAVAVPVSVFLLFPVVLLSMLEAESLVVPVTMTVLSTFVLVWRTWLLFYFETALLVAATAGLAGVMLRRWPLQAIVPATILLVAGLLLYFRLLGRVAWCCSEAMREVEVEDEEAEGDEEEGV